MQKLTPIVEQLAGIVWGPVFLVPLLLLTGLYLTVRLRGLQFRKLWQGLYVAFVVRTEPESKGDISHFQALMTALASTVGTGNIVGVATAIALGGPGALFWMWMTGLVGMATKYSEAILSVKYRTTNAVGEHSGGPMYYLSRGVRWKPLGRALAVMFAACGAVAVLGTGNMVQSNAISDALHQSFEIPKWLSGVSVCFLVALVILGGIRSIGRFTGFFVPLMILVYVGGTGTIIVTHLEAVPAAFASVFHGAFNGTAAAGGFVGVAVAQSIRFGVARGIFSNESGLGSAGIAAAAAQTRTPARQAIVSMTQTFIDTLVVCTLTGLTILVTGAWQSGLNGAPLTQLAFRTGLSGSWGGWIVAISLSMFAYSSMLGWCFYGERCVEYLLGRRAVFPYRVLFIVAAFLGTVYSLTFVWTVSDLMNGLMALPNLVGLLLLSRVVVQETRALEEKSVE